MMQTVTRKMKKNKKLRRKGYDNNNNRNIINYVYVQVSERRKINSIIERFPICNGCSDRAPHIREFCFPLCWRCFSISVGMILCYLMYRADFFLKFNFAGILCAMLGIIICILDATVQKLTDYESTNKKRIVFGFVAGYGVRYIFLGFFGI